VTFADMMALEPHGPDTYVGTGPRYPWGGLYGGQIVAQGLRAAGLTVDARYRPNSLHAYFIRPGDHDEPIRFEVDRDRDGRSFCTRRVVARQSIGAILNMAASFHVAEEGPDVQVVAMPEVPPPDDVEGPSWTGMFERRFIDAPGTDAGRSVAWLRLHDRVGDDPLLQACGLAYVSDDLPTDSVFALHPDRPPLDEMSVENAHEVLLSASLDHAIWFHRPADPSAWQLHDLTAQGFRGGRGLASGTVFTADGHRVATISQEVLVRRRR
jgi:acyl-CoA thioesterase-2